MIFEYTQWARINIGSHELCDNSLNKNQFIIMITSC